MSENASSFLLYDIQKPGIKRKLPQYDLEHLFFKNTVKMTIIYGRLKVFLLWSWTKQWCLLSPFLFNILLEILDRTIKQEKEINCSQIGGKELKLFLFR